LVRGHKFWWAEIYYSGVIKINHKGYRTQQNNLRRIK